MPKGTFWPNYFSKAARSFSTTPGKLTNGMPQKDSHFRQLAKFIFVGVLNTAVGYLAFLIFLNYANYLAALVVSHVIGVTHSYIWNKYWTFKSSKLQIGEFIRFNSVYAIVLAMNAVVLVFLVDSLNLNPRLGQLIALPAVTIISFTGHRRWSFKKT